MKCSKKHFIPVIISLGLATIVPYTPSVKAAELSEAQIESHFSDLNDHQVVVLLPEGGIIYNNEGLSYSEEELWLYGASAKTVEEVKEIYLTGTIEDYAVSGLASRAAHPYWTSVQLKAGETYLSQPFSGKGWRFAGRSFYPQPGTGAYLYYRAIGDDGRVGNINDGINMWFYGSGNYGTPLYSYQGWVPIYIGDTITNANNAKGFFTFNPAPGSK